MSTSRRVIKLGGSLLHWGDVCARFPEWLRLQPAAENLILIGGGAAVDCVRDFDRTHELSEQASHWLAVRGMQMNMHMAATLWPELQLVSSIDELSTEPAPNSWLVDPWRLMRDADQKHSSQPLPERWDVTSDSIAARLASLIGAAELVLMKSCLPDKPTVWTAGRTGYVDAYFGTAARSLGATIRCVNLRSPAFEECTLAPE